MAIKVRRGKLYPPVDIQYAVSLGLDELEWDLIVDRLGRPPNHFECSIFASLWSDEVSNKSSASLLDSVYREMPEVTQVPGSQIGVVEISEGEYLALRVVNNNKQSYIDPYYGAQTAIDSALEELSSIGASPLGVLNMLRFGSHDLIENRRLFQGAVDGIGAFGSKYGVPIVGGELYFHKRYNGGVMINSGVVGILKNENALTQDEVAYNSPVLYVGGKTGLDGLTHLDESDEDVLDGHKRFKTTIKMSDPLLANRIVSACAEAIEAGILKEVISVGKGGLAVACFDLANRINKPVLLDIDRIPLRKDDMKPLEIILSESSERVLMITNRDNHRKLNEILYKWDLQSVKVGEVNDSDGIEFYWNHYLAADIPFQFALGGAVEKEFQVVQFPPMLKRSADSSDADRIRKRKRKVVDEWSLIREVALAQEQNDEDKEIDCPANLEDIWLDMLANPNLCSRSAMYTMFDQVVGANTLQSPGGDSAVLRLRTGLHVEQLLADKNVTLQLADDVQNETSVESASDVIDGSELSASNTNNGNGSQNGYPKGDPKRAIAVTMDANSLYVSQEPYLGTVQTVAESMRNLAAVGARPIGLAYCLNYGDPERYKEVCDLAESIRGLGDASKIWDIPILSKQICLKNGTEGNPTLPTPTVLMAGIIDDATKMCRIGFRDRGDRVLLLGLTENEITCTEYSQYAHRFVNKLVPDIKFDEEKKVCDLIISLIEKRLLQSCHDLSGGGLAVALTECCMLRPRPLGTVFEIDEQVFETPNGPLPLRRDSALFSETSGRFLISCKPENEEQIEELCSELDIPITGRGTVGGKVVEIKGAVNVELPLSTTYKLWIHRLETLLGQGGQETVGFAA